MCDFKSFVHFLHELIRLQKEGGSQRQIVRAYTMTSQLWRNNSPSMAHFKSNYTQWREDNNYEHTSDNIITFYHTQSAISQPDVREKMCPYCDDNISHLNVVLSHREKLPCEWTPTDKIAYMVKHRTLPDCWCHRCWMDRHDIGCGDCAQIQSSNYHEGSRYQNDNFDPIKHALSLRCDHCE